MKSIFRRQILTVTFAAVALIQTARADQGHMERALNALYQARNELSQASHDKGGHRVNAIQMINQAIQQIKRGIAVGARHGD
jgi:flagellar biosynthesis chaperone FliJ